MECYKRGFVGTSTQLYFVSYTCNKLDVTLAHIFLRFLWLLVSDMGGPRVRETVQAIFFMESRRMGLLGLLGMLGKL
jgi:hypothetical protein